MRKALRDERKIAQDRAYVLRGGAVIETEEADGRVVKCYLAAGDVIRIDQVEGAGDDRMVTVSYAPVEPADPAEDVRCAASTSVTFMEMNVEQLIGKNE